MLEAQGYSVHSYAPGEAMGSYSCGFHFVLNSMCRSSPGVEGNQLLRAQDKPLATASPGLESPGQPCLARLVPRGGNVAWPSNVVFVVWVPLPGLSSSAMSGMTGIHKVIWQTGALQRTLPTGPLE